MDLLTQIKKRIAVLLKDSLLSVWNSGLQNSNLLINPCISENELEILEERYNVSLPWGYREYVLNIGNGGNQPGVGMFTVEQSLALMFGRIADENELSYKDLTQYYQCINLHNSKDLLKYYYSIFGEPVRKLEVEIESFERNLDDYFDSNGIFKYQNMLVDDENEFLYYEFEMKKHLLIFSFNEATRTEFAIAMDGKYAGNVVYYSYDPIATIMNNRNIFYTNMLFLDWMNNMYNSSCAIEKIN